MDINRTVQIALLGQVPPSLRFLYASHEDNVLRFHAVFDESATEDHLESARCVCTEILASCIGDIKLEEIVEIDDKKHWKINDGKNLMYLRYGELDDS